VNPGLPERCPVVPHVVGDSGACRLTSYYRSSRSGSRRFSVGRGLPWMTSRQCRLPTMPPGVYPLMAFTLSQLPICIRRHGRLAKLRGSGSVVMRVTIRVEFTCRILIKTRPQPNQYTIFRYTEGLPVGSLYSSVRERQFTPDRPSRTGLPTFVFGPVRSTRLHARNDLCVSVHRSLSG
jgi:hypothetical protein